MSMCLLSSPQAATHPHNSELASITPIHHTHLVLVDLGRVDIDVHDARVGRKRLQLAC